MSTAQKSAFRRGFSAGMSSPYEAIFGRRALYGTGPRDLVTVSWQEVGRSVREALEEERSNHGEAARADTKRK
jgi:hypothetical protein